LLNKYEQSLDWLFKQFPSFQNLGAEAYKPGLSNVISLLNLFDNPQDKLQFIHIAGTNGKGSTASFTASILTELGEKVGLFTSPHIFDFRERIRINGKKITEEEVISFCKKIKTLKLNFKPSFFEITFVLSLVHFEAKNCSICLIETGLGGRLDATNCILPKISIITNIGMDHMNFLGNTLKEIAFEKAGIIKENTAVVIGKTQNELKEIFTEIAKEKKAQIYFADENKNNTIEVYPSYQIENLQTALKSLELLSHSISQKIIQKSIDNLQKNTGLFARMTHINRNPNIILDVSHNEDGIKATLKGLNLNPKGKLIVLLGSSNEKNINLHMNLFTDIATIYLCTFRNERSRKFEEYQILKNQNPKIKDVFEDVNLAIRKIKETLSKEDTLLVIGSFFLIADFKTDSKPS
jgi:dihydrofolate synthase / folylpolyglutamate synthase